jgi:hypothetical protein
MHEPTPEPVPVVIRLDRDSYDLPVIHAVVGGVIGISTTATAGPAAAQLVRDLAIGAARRARAERWRAATHAQTLARTDAELIPGRPPTGVYIPVPIVHPPGYCRHLDTICVGCLRSWQDDLLVALFDHGPGGAAHGCRCPTCHTPAPAGPASTGETADAGPGPAAPGMPDAGSDRHSRPQPGEPPPAATDPG